MKISVTALFFIIGLFAQENNYKVDGSVAVDGQTLSSVLSIIRSTKSIPLDLSSLENSIAILSLKELISGQRLENENPTGLAENTQETLKTNPLVNLNTTIKSKRKEEPSIDTIRTKSTRLSVSKPYSNRNVPLRYTLIEGANLPYSANKIESPVQINKQVLNTQNRRIRVPINLLLQLLLPYEEKELKSNNGNLPNSESVSVPLTMSFNGEEDRVPSLEEVEEPKPVPQLDVEEEQINEPQQYLVRRQVLFNQENYPQYIPLVFKLSQKN